MTIIQQFLVIVAILLTCIFMGTTIAFSLSFTCIMAIVIFLAPSQLLQMGSIAIRQGTNINQLVAPLFIMMAEFLTLGDVATDIFTVLNRALQKFKGGLAISAVLACTVFAALCGSSPATAAAIGRISIREMVKHGYRPDFAAGTVAGAGTLGILIPPSITFVSYCMITENSIAKLLMAGVIPGLMLSFMMCISIIIRVRLNPSLANVDSAEFKNALAADEAIAKAESHAKNQLTKSEVRMNNIKLLVPPMILILVVLGSMYLGWATPMESAGVGVIGAFLLVLFRGRFSKGLFSNVMKNTAKTGNMVMFITISGLSLSYVVSYLGLAQGIANIIIGLNVNRYVVIVLLYIMWYIMGCLLDPGSMIVLTIPFIYPTLMALGFDPIWLGVVAVICVEVGMITPPVGFNLFVIKNVSELPISQVIKGVIPYVGILTLALIILTIFPEICLFLPSRM